MSSATASALAESPAIARADAAPNSTSRPVESSRAAAARAAPSRAFPNKASRMAAPASHRAPRSGWPAWRACSRARPETPLDSRRRPAHARARASLSEIQFSATDRPRACATTDFISSRSLARKARECRGGKLSQSGKDSGRGTFDRGDLKEVVGYVVLYGATID